MAAPKRMAAPKKFKLIKKLSPRSESIQPGVQSISAEALARSASLRAEVRALDRDMMSNAAMFAEVGKPTPILPVESAARKEIPIAEGVLDYFPAAIAYVARISKVGNDKHNPGQPMHHARSKSGDHANCIGRHLIERGTYDIEDNLRHSGKLAWRALALLQEELEREEGAPLPRGAKL